MSWENWHATVETERERCGSFNAPAPLATGYAIGIIAVNLAYPKIPGNVQCATTFSFPVVYEGVNFEIEQLFAGDPSIQDMVVEAARKLEAQGVRAIVGACGFFAHFQNVVADAVNVPVFLSSLAQIPLIRTGVGSQGEILVLAADGASVTDELLAPVGATSERIHVCNVGDLDSFAAIRWSRGALDNEALTQDLIARAQNAIEAHPKTRAILLECSDLPPYAAAIQRATLLPVFDFITLINWVYSGIVQKSYYGFI